MIGVSVALSGCGGKKPQPTRAKLKEQVKQIVKQEAQPATVRISGGTFQADDESGQPVVMARISSVGALVQPSQPSQGPVTLKQANCTLYKEGKPSLWLKAPVVLWEAGLLTAATGAHAGSVDGKMNVQGKRVTWTARANLLSVTTAGCELREPGQPALLATGPAATWQTGLLILPSGAAAHTVDRSASMRADRVRWRAATHNLEATGRVRMTRDRMAGSAARLTGDTSLRQFRLTGGRPHVIFYNQPAPLVAALDGVGRSTRMSRTRFPFSLAILSGAVLLATMPLPAAPAASRAHASLASGGDVEANEISYTPETGIHAVGDVVLTNPKGTLRADQVDVKLRQQQAAPGAARSPVEEAVATGHVRITSQPKPDEHMEATGAAGTYWPGTQRAALTGGVTVTMTSPQLLEPAVLTGARADLDLARRTATVGRTAAAQVAVRLRPKQATTPVSLDADKVLVDNAANRITASGSPVMTGDQGTVHAERIWFDIDPSAKDIKTVHAVGAVQIDSQDAQHGSFHATSREAVLNRDANTVILTGNARGTHIQPGQTEPDRFQGEELTYNTKTGAYRLSASPETRARVTYQPKPKPAGGSTDN